jgi:hypothetical protein
MLMASRSLAALGMTPSFGKTLRRQIMTNFKIETLEHIPFGWNRHSLSVLFVPCRRRRTLPSYAARSDCRCAP